MNKRPLAVTLIGWLYVVTGAFGTVSHLMQFKPHAPFEFDIVAAVLVSVVAIVAGAYLLRGCHWARWLAVAWMAFHVVLSFFSSRSELAIHSAFFVVIVYFLFRPQVSQYLGRHA